MTQRPGHRRDGQVAPRACSRPPGADGVDVSRSAAAGRRPRRPATPIARASIAAQTRRRRSTPPPTPRSTRPRASRSWPSPSTRDGAGDARRGRAARRRAAHPCLDRLCLRRRKRGALSRGRPVGPLGVYGASKLAGEQAVRGRATRATSSCAPPGSMRRTAHNFVQDHAAPRRERDRAAGRRRPARRPDPAADIASAPGDRQAAGRRGAGGRRLRHLPSRRRRRRRPGAASPRDLRAAGRHGGPPVPVRRRSPPPTIRPRQRGRPIRALDCARLAPRLRHSPAALATTALDDVPRSALAATR